MRSLVISSLLILSAAILAGCTHPSGYVVSLVDTEYYFQPKQSIYLYLPKTATLEEKKYHDLLINQMKSLRFELADDMEHSDMTFQFILAHNTIPQEGSFFLPILNRTQGSSTDAKGRSTTFSFSTFGNILIPYATYKSYELVFLYVYDTRRLLDDSVFTPVWQVSFIAESKDFICDTEVWTSNLLRMYQREMAGEATLGENGVMKVYQWHCGDLQVINVH